ncbi:hypothetical protein ACFFX0_23625 [Citricoccus parietis]|uniref:Uncharacterized protein n=1 Tax=Citricoccus parietis TaxID=592307 RepID=A0ABV5G507_9MICC
MVPEPQGAPAARILSLIVNPIHPRRRRMAGSVPGGRSGARGTDEAARYVPCALWS